MYVFSCSYVSNYAYDGYKAYCQRKLLKMPVNVAPRSCPPCLLEWWSAKTFERMALPFSYPLGDTFSLCNCLSLLILVGESGHFELDSWTTASEVAKALAQNK